MALGVMEDHRPHDNQTKADELQPAPLMPSLGCAHAAVPRPVKRHVDQPHERCYKQVENGGLQGRAVLTDPEEPDVIEEEAHEGHADQDPKLVRVGEHVHVVTNVLMPDSRHVAQGLHACRHPRELSSHELKELKEVFEGYARFNEALQGSGRG